MGVPAWIAVNALESASRVDGQPLSGGDPNIWSASLLETAFPASQLYDWRPGTVARFTSLAERALVAEFAASQGFDTIWLANHNLPSDATLKLMTSATGVVGAWNSQWSASAAELGEADLVVVLPATVTAKYIALVLTGLGTLADPWEVGEWGIGTRNALPVSWEFDAAPRGKVRRRVVNRSQYGILEQKALGLAARSYEGMIGLGQDDAGIDDIEALATATSGGVAPFLWINDVAASVGVVATAEGLEAFEPRLLAPDVYASLSLRIDGVPRGRGTV